MISADLVRAIRATVADGLSERDAQDEASGRRRLDVDDRRALAAALINDEFEALARERLRTGAPQLTQEEEQDLLLEVLAAMFGVGAFERYLALDDVEEVTANGCDEVWLHLSDGTKRSADPVAASDSELVEILKGAAARLGRSERRFDAAQPILNLRLPDGSRLHAIMEVSERPCVSIRRHRYRKMTLADLVGLGTIDETLSRFLAAIVAARRNVLVCGGVNAGKTTFLRGLISEIEPAERLVVVEDDAELCLRADRAAHPDVVELERRDANIEGQGLIDMARLVREALRMRPDRVIVGEVRGGEVVPMLHAMNQGNDGSMCTLHADATRTAFSRLITYAASAKEAYPPHVTARLVGDSLHFVVHLQRLGDGRRVVTSVREVTGSDGDLVLSNEVFAPGPDYRARPAAPLRAETAALLESVGFDRTMFATAMERWR